MKIENELSETKYAYEDVIPSFLVPNHLIKQGDSNHNKIYPTPVNNINAITQKDSSVFYDENISEMVIREKMHHAIEIEHVDLFMQPIVTLPQRKIKLYEFFGRLRINPGQYIPAKDYLEIANEEHIISNLDTLFLSSCLKVIKKQQYKEDNTASYFINIKPFTLRNHNFMNNLVALLSRDKKIANTLIFEMHFHDFLLLSPAEKKILDELAKTGCKFSLDHISDMPSNVNQLNKMHIHFVKIDAKILLEKGKTETGFHDILIKKHELDSYNINLIVEKIESEADLIELLDYEIKYGQGFLFGKPDFSGVYT